MRKDLAEKSKLIFFRHCFVFFACEGQWARFRGGFKSILDMGFGVFISTGAFRGGSLLHTLFGQKWLKGIIPNAWNVTFVARLTIIASSPFRPNPPVSRTQKRTLENLIQMSSSPFLTQRGTLTTNNSRPFTLNPLIDNPRS